MEHIVEPLQAEIRLPAEEEELHYVSDVILELCKNNNNNDGVMW